MNATVAVRPDVAVHVVARTSSGRCILPNQQFTAIIHGQRVGRYRQRFTYLGQVEMDDDGRHWLHARRRSGTVEWVALDAVQTVHRGWL